MRTMLNKSGVTPFHSTQSVLSTLVTIFMPASLSKFTAYAIFNPEGLQSFTRILSPIGIPKIISSNLMPALFSISIVRSRYLSTLDPKFSDFMATSG